MKRWEMENMNYMEREMVKKHHEVVDEMQAEIDELKKKIKNTEGRKEELTQHIMLLSSIPETCGRYMHEMNDAVTELHELMGFRKHNKG